MQLLIIVVVTDVVVITCAIVRYLEWVDRRG